MSPLEELNIWHVFGGRCFCQIRLAITEIMMQLSVWTVHKKRCKPRQRLSFIWVLKSWVRISTRISTECSLQDTINLFFSLPIIFLRTKVKKTNFFSKIKTSACVLIYVYSNKKSHWQFSYHIGASGNTKFLRLVPIMFCFIQSQNPWLWSHFKHCRFQNLTKSTWYRENNGNLLNRAKTNKNF